MDIQPLQHNDLESITQLQPEGWPDISANIKFYTQSSFCFPIKVIINEQIVGIGAAIIHNDVAWLGHIIVHRDNRKQGIGKFITQTLIDIARSKYCNTIYLVATDLGEPVYKKLGFETETEYIFFKNPKPNASWLTSNAIVPFDDEHKMQITFLDKKVSGENRMMHLDGFLAGSFVYQQNDVIKGFYLPALGDGLIVADTMLAGLELMKFRLTIKDHAVFPVDNVAAITFMNENNSIEFRKAKRMRLGLTRTWQPENIYNRIGGNLG